VSARVQCQLYSTHNRISVTFHLCGLEWVKPSFPGSPYTLITQHAICMHLVHAHRPCDMGKTVLTAAIWHTPIESYYYVLAAICSGKQQPAVLLLASSQAVQPSWHRPGSRACRLLRPATPAARNPTYAGALRGPNQLNHTSWPAHTNCNH
jgi:hypothetical protein